MSSPRVPLAEPLAGIRFTVSVRTGTCLHDEGSYCIHALMSLFSRRLVGCLAGVLTLVLTTGALEAPCDASAPGASRAVSDSQHQHLMSHHTPGKSSEQSKHCPTTTVPCCSAIASCVQMLEPTARFSTVVADPANKIDLLNLPAPSSRVAAPESPPPKA
jgi:hypothetical protein